MFKKILHVEISCCLDHFVCIYMY